MLTILLPTWLNRGTVKKIAEALLLWWNQVKTWLSIPLEQINPDTCTVGFLNLIAYARNIERFPEEPEHLYRLRVKYAHVNAIDAGSVAGIKRIFHRLGIGDVQVHERTPGRDWDVIVVQLSDANLSENQTLLTYLLTKYGRTCRRYEFNLVSEAFLGVSLHEFGHQWVFDSAA